ncbi:MAG: hypothetical protein FWE09_00395 [Treponema sp.]|nr:hypothetical protein [Treponema sp.]
MDNKQSNDAGARDIPDDSPDFQSDDQGPGAPASDAPGGNSGAGAPKGGEAPKPPAKAKAPAKGGAKASEDGKKDEPAKSPTPSADGRRRVRCVSLAGDRMFLGDGTVAEVDDEGWFETGEAEAERLLSIPGFEAA